MFSERTTALHDSIWRALWVLLLTVALCLPAAAEHGGSFANSASDAVYPFMALGEIILFTDGARGKEAAEQGAKALGSSMLASESLKSLIHEERPDHSDDESFPSTHTAGAFAMATVLSDYDHKYTVPAYGIAAVIGWSRVQTDKHHWWDVAAGALLGHVVSRQFTRGTVAFTGNGIALQWSM